MIAANLTITEPRKQQIEFTVPIGTTYEQLVIRSEDNNIHHVSDLKGRTLSVRPNTSFWNYCQRPPKTTRGCHDRSPSG